MKSAQSQENTQKPMPGSTKQQIASTLTKAVRSAANLVEVLQDKTTTHSTTEDIIEAKAYLAMMRGSLAFEKKQWKKCLQQFSVTHVAYTTLAAKSKGDGFKELLDTVVDTSIRYAAYQLQLPRTKPIPEITIEEFPDSEKESRDELKEVDPKAFDITKEAKAAGLEDVKDAPTSISWRSRTVKIGDATISQALGIAASKEKDIASKYESYVEGGIDAKAFATAYDGIIDVRQDAADATKEAIDELRSEGVDPGDSRIQSLQVTRTAVNYGVIEWRVGRNRILCGIGDGLIFEPEKSKKQPKESEDGKARQPKDEPSGKKLSRLRERAALYDSILQSLDVVRDLPGVAADSEFVNEIDGKQNYFRALKCLSIGRSHAINDNATNALALFSRAHDMILVAAKSNSGTTSASSAPKLEVSSQQVEAASTHISQLVTRYRGLVELHNVSTTGTKAKAEWKAPMVERLSQFEEDVDLTSLVNYPPKLQPIPVKPLFFDLAWNYIQYPGGKATLNGSPAKSASTETAEEQKEQTQKKGWFGFGR
jgi:signal recognition particle subunit SRP68